MTLILIFSFTTHNRKLQTVSLVTVTSTCEEYKDTLISAINAITEHSLLAKSQANFVRAKKESLKANEVIVLGDFVENYQFLLQDETQSYHWSKEYYTHLLYVLLTMMEICNTTLLGLSLMIRTSVQSFFIKYKQSLLITLKKTLQFWIRSSISLTAVLDNIRIAKLC